MIALTLFLLLFIVFSLRHFILGGGAAASVDALCPFGGFETLYTFLATGGFIPRVLMSSLILAVGITLTTLILGKSFCGYICPFGFVQELLGKIKKKKPKLNKRYDREARSLKYAVVGMILLGTALTGTLVFRLFDPFMTLFHFGKGIFWAIEPSELASHIFTFVLTVILLILAIFIPRFWCRYLCPLAATMNLFQKLSATKITRNKKTCISCKACDKKCPMAVKPSKADNMKDLECINCNQCVEVCPKQSLEIKTFNKKISTTLYLILTFVIFFGVVFAAKFAGVWQSVPIIEDIKAPTGEINSDQIKGWMTLNEVAEASGIGVYHFQEDLGLEGIDPDTPLKEIKNQIPGFETEVIRDYVDGFVHSCGGHQAPESESQVDSNAEPNGIVECPWGVENDPVRRCGLYEDTDGNGICDLSE